MRLTSYSLGMGCGTEPDRLGYGCTKGLTLKNKEWCHETVTCKQYDIMRKYIFFYLTRMSLFAVFFAC